MIKKVLLLAVTISILGFFGNAATAQEKAGEGECTYHDGLCAK